MFILVMTMKSAYKKNNHNKLLRHFIICYIIHIIISIKKNMEIHHIDHLLDDIEQNFDIN